MCKFQETLESAKKTPTNRTKCCLIDLPTHAHTLVSTYRSSRSVSHTQSLKYALKKANLRLRPSPPLSPSVHVSRLLFEKPKANSNTGCLIADPPSLHVLMHAIYVVFSPVFLRSLFVLRSFRRPRPPTARPRIFNAFGFYLRGDDRYKNHLFFADGVFFSS